MEHLWWIPVLAFLVAWSALGVIRSRQAQARNQAIASILGTRDMARVFDERSPFLPSMLPLDVRVCRNTFATSDWSLWFSEVGDARSPGSFAVLLFSVDGLNLPYISVARKGEVDVPLGARGQSVQLESIDFANRFQIRADDVRAAVMVIDPGMMQWLLDCDRVSFEVSGPLVSAIVKVRDKRSVQPPEPALLLRFFDGFAAHVPGLVRTEFPSPAGLGEAAMQASLIASSLLTGERPTSA